MRNSILEQEPHPVQLAVGNRCCSAPVADKPDDSNFAKNLNFLRKKLGRTDEDLAGKEWEIDQLSWVTPLPGLLNCREIPLQVICQKADCRLFSRAGISYEWRTTALYPQ